MVFQAQYLRCSINGVATQYQSRIFGGLERNKKAMAVKTEQERMFEIVW